MPATCGVCHEKESKYRCPKCNLRFCSVPCNRVHKVTHENATEVEPPKSVDAGPRQDSLKQDVPTTGSQIDKKLTDEQSKFAGFENDPELKRLLGRFPKLKYELQLVYGVTLEPGPDEVYTWGKRMWFDDGSASQQTNARRSLGGRGRVRGRGGHHEDFLGHRGRNPNELPVEERQHGPWTQQKGDKQALDLIRKLREANDSDISEGMMEFIRLCAIRSGQ